MTDLVHLLAELLENATTFSSPQTKVRVTATRLPDGRVMVEIHDKGIGLTAEDFADINHKLANPPTVDAAISQRMGLFVVGRLSDRHGIRVQLRPSGEQAGTTSLVMLPDVITHGGGGEQLPEADFTVSSMIPSQSAYEPAPLRTAAELGFDDSRYGEVPDDRATWTRSAARCCARSAARPWRPRRTPVTTAPCSATRSRRRKGRTRTSSSRPPTRPRSPRTTTVSSRRTRTPRPSTRRAGRRTTSSRRTAPTTTRSSRRRTATRPRTPMRNPSRRRTRHSAAVRGQLAAGRLADARRLPGAAPVRAQRSSGIRAAR